MDREPVQQIIREITKYLYDKTEVLILGEENENNLIYLAKNGARITAIDNNLTKIESLEVLARKYIITRKKGDAKKIETLPDKEYDFIICSHILEELQLQEAIEGAKYAQTHIKKHGYLLVVSGIAQRKMIRNVAREEIFENWKEIINKITTKDCENNLEILIQKK